MSYAREMVAHKVARIRWTRLDNTPDGRPVHWSSLFPWWLVALGAARGLVTGEPIASAITAAAYYANPLLLAILVALAGWAAWRRVGPVAAAVLVLAVASHPGLLADFSYARPDHHGLAICAALGTLLCALLGGAGWASDRESSGPGSPPPLGEARRWFIASGILGGVGLWAGATQMSVVIASIGVGGGLAALVFVTAPDASAAPADSGESAIRIHPELWRWWARAGATTALVGYAIEYLPGPVEMRLEVNHPLYALAWLCGGEILFGLGRWRLQLLERSIWVRIAVPFLLGGALLLPVAIAAGPTSWYWPKDPTMLNLHLRIDEFLPFFAMPRSAAESIALLGVPVLSVLAATLALGMRRSSPSAAGALLLCVVPGWVLAAWFLFQSRWLGLFCAAGVCAAMLLCGLAERGLVKRARCRGVSIAFLSIVAVALLAGLGSNWSRVAVPTNGDPGVPLVLDVFARDLARNLCPPRPRGGPVRVMTGPSEASRIHFFGRCRGVGTPYWENVDGVRATADFFAAADEDAARKIVYDREIDYVVIANSIQFVEYMQITKSAIAEPGAVEKTLGHRLLSGTPPEWLQPVTIRDWPAARYWRVFRVRRS